MHKIYSVLLVLLLLPCLLFGQGFGSYSLTQVQTARTFKPKRLDFRTNMKFFTKLGDFIGASKPDNFQAVNFWSVNSNALLTYGIAEHFDATFAVKAYQDVHKPNNEANAPGDLFLFLKTGDFGLSNNKFMLGGQFTTRFPTGESHNYPFEPYASSSVQFGIMALASYYNDPFLPHRDYSFHFNAEWYYWNDAGKTVVEAAETGGQSDILAGNNASAFRYGVGFTYPTELFDLNLEFYGNTFISQPDSLVFSRDDYAYLTPSIRFKPTRRLNFDLGIDIRVSSDNSTSKRSFSQSNITLPQYSSWKVILGTGIVMSPGADRFKGGIGDKADIKEKVDFYERLLKEREKTRSIEEELRRLKREREQAEKELEELRQLLEEEG